MTNQLNGLLGKVERVLAARPECFITHPTELIVLHKVTEADLREMARERGWRMVWRVGGRVIEFHNDVTVRPFESGRNAA